MHEEVNDVQREPAPFEELIELLKEHGALLADGFDSALRGAVTGWFHGGHLTVALYDSEMCIKIISDELQVPWDEAEEFFEFNVAGSYVGEGTPAFAVLYR